MHSRMRAVETITSSAGTRPLPSARGTRRCEITAFHDGGELQPHLLLLVGREDGDDAVDRLGGVERVQRAHHEVAGLGCRDRRFDGLEVAHLADQDDVRILAKGGAKRVREAVRIDTDLTLIHDRAAIANQELDRVSRSS